MFFFNQHCNASCPVHSMPCTFVLLRKLEITKNLTIALPGTISKMKLVKLI